MLDTTVTGIYKESQPKIERFNIRHLSNSTLNPMLFAHFAKKSSLAGILHSWLCTYGSAELRRVAIVSKTVSEMCYPGSF